MPVKVRWVNVDGRVLLLFFPDLDMVLLAFVVHLLPSIDASDEESVSIVLYVLHVFVLVVGFPVTSCGRPAV